MKLPHILHRTAPRGTRRPGPAQRGFTLVELLVAIALGLLVMIALIAVYTNVSRTNSEMAKTNSMIENGRFTIDVLNEDIIHAGYWGGYVPLWDSLAFRNDPSAVVPEQAMVDNGPCWAFSNWNDPANADHVRYHNYLVGIPVEAFRDAGPPGCPSSVIEDRKPGTDVLVVRHAETCLPGESNCEALDSNKVYFQSSQCDIELDATPPMRSVLTNGTGSFILHTKVCGGSAPASVTGTVAPLRKFVSNIYYVRTWSTKPGGVADGIPTLVRSSFGVTGGAPQFTAPQALIEGVEAFGVELGIDAQNRCPGSFSNYTATLTLGPAGTLVDPATCTYNAAITTKNTLPMVRGDGTPESFVRCPAAGCSVEQLRDTVAVKVFVLARARDASPGHTDGKTYNLGSGGSDTMVVTPTGADALFKRHVFQTTIRMVNVSGRRETPKP
jgi:type IV pilus assembly protein PilW